MDVCEQILHFGGLGHTCVIYSKDEERVRQFAARMPAFRVLVNTSAPQGSVGITTNVPPSMTLGCGAMGGNSTGDNVGPQHLINIKRLAFLAREPEEALQIPKVTPRTPSAAAIDRDAIVAAVEKILAERNLAGAPAVSHAVLAGVAASVVDQLAAGSRQKSEAACPAPESACAAPPGAAQPSGTTPAAETPASVNFVCENDVREAIREGRKIYIGPRTIVTPSAREAAAPGEILVMVEP
jgi:acetaldehyde dehydrogenase (acetylating)